MTVNLPKRSTAVKWVSIGLIVVVAVAGGMYYMNSKKTSTSTTTTQQATVTKDTLKVEIQSDGSAALDTQYLDFKISGTLSGVNVKEGDVVKAGTILATLDDTSYREKYDTAKASYDRSLAAYNAAKESYETSKISEKSSVDNAKSAFDTAASNYLPIANLTDVYSAQEIQQKKLTYDSSKNSYDAAVKRYNIVGNSQTNLQSAKAALDSSAVDLDTAKRELDYTVLKAVSDTKILNVSAKTGETVTTNTSSSSSTSTTTAETTHFLTILASPKVETKSPVSEIDLSKIKLGQKAKATFDALQGQTFSGVVSKIYPLPVISSSGIVTYNVNVQLDNPSDDIRNGMTSSTSFILKEADDVLVIPNKAVTMTDGKQYVTVKSSDGTAKQQVITTGFTDGTNCEVKSGLKEGDIVQYQQAGKTTTTSAASSSSNQQ